MRIIKDLDNKKEYRFEVFNVNDTVLIAESEVDPQRLIFQVYD